MQNRLMRSILSLDLEERILNAGAFVAAMSVFLPWMSDVWPTGESASGTTLTYSGFGYSTSVLGLVVFLLNIFIVLLTVVPLAGGPVIIRKRYRETVRLLLSAQSSILILAALSVLTKITFESSHMEIRFGIYFALVGSLVTLFETVLRYLEQRRSLVQELFHHPEDKDSVPDRKDSLRQTPPPPPPPPPPAAEEHPLYP